MNLAEIKKDARFWQRLLRFAGYYHGCIDGILGKQSHFAEMCWSCDQAALLRSFGVLDKRSEENLETIIPRAQIAMRDWLSRAIPAAKEHGYTLKVICGTRSYKEQDALYAQGPHVTKARGGFSNHNFGLAIDIGLFSQNGKYVGDGAPYDALARYCPPPATLEWGGTWKSLHDSPHYQSSIFGDSTAAIRKRFEA